MARQGGTLAKYFAFAGRWTAPFKTWGLPMGNSENQPVDPNRLNAQQAAKLLSAAAGVKVPEQNIQQDLTDGVPKNGDGTFSLISYAAWLLKEMGRGR